MGITDVMIAATDEVLPVVSLFPVTIGGFIINHKETD